MLAMTSMIRNLLLNLQSVKYARLPLDPSHHDQTEPMNFSASAQTSPPSKVSGSHLSVLQLTLSYAWFYLFTPGGILTVADDLLKNDGSKFLEMMEQLAVARHVREEQNIRDLEETDEEEYDEDKE